MRVASNLQRGQVGWNMTPMIDVSFLLIVFFLVSSTMAQQETQLDLKLPDASSGEQPPQQRQRRVTVNVLPDGSMIAGGRGVELAGLERLIAAEKGRDADPLEVRVRCDRSVPYRRVEPVLVTCARAGIWKVTFAVVRDRQAQAPGTNPQRRGVRDAIPDPAVSVALAQFCYPCTATPVSNAP
jgi:biopolymer transport protein ExbD